MPWAAGPAPSPCDTMFNYNKKEGKERRTMSLGLSFHSIGFYEIPRPGPSFEQPVADPNHTIPRRNIPT